MALDASIADIDAKINAARQRLADKPFVVTPEAEYPPFDPKIPYDKKKDPFYDVPKKYLKDVSNKPWLDRGQASGPFIDHELAEVLDKVHETLSDPKKVDQLPPDIKKAVQDTGFRLKVVSGSRTPWKQATEIPQAKAKGLPAADYSKSKHMFGQEVDIEQPYKEGTEKYKSVEKILNHFGVQILKGDRVHILMPNKTFSQKVTALAMIREYKRVASSLRAKQASTKQDLIFLKNSAEQQKQQLEKDLEARRSERDKKAEIFEKNSAVLRGINSEIQRKEAEAREAERRNRGGDRPDRDFPRGPREAGGGHHDMGGSRGRGEVIVFDKPEVIVGRRP